MKHLIDFHGWNTDDVLTEIAHIVGKVRGNQSSMRVDFITGHGIIQTLVVEELITYGLDPSVQSFNSGVITVLVE